MFQDRRSKNISRAKTKDSAKDVQRSPVPDKATNRSLAGTTVRSVSPLQRCASRAHRGVSNAPQIYQLLRPSGTVDRNSQSRRPRSSQRPLCSDVLPRLEKAFKAFFQRIQRGQKPGFPRFKSSRRYARITFPSHGDGNKLLTSGHWFVQGVGNIKVKLHRPWHGKIKTVSVKRECEHWYVCFAVETSVQPLPETKAAVGIDLGLSSFATRSDDAEIENPRLYRQAQKKLRRAQRRVARRKKGSKRRRKAVVFLRKIHQHIFNQRNDHHHKLARMLVQQFGKIFVEDLNIQGLSRGMLSKAVQDASWASFLAKLAYQAEEAGRQLVKVDPRGTSPQRCPCGARVPKKLSDREHVCT